MRSVIPARVHQIAREHEERNGEQGKPVQAVDHQPRQYAEREVADDQRNDRGDADGDAHGNAQRDERDHHQQEREGDHGQDPSGDAHARLQLPDRCVRMEAPGHVNG